MSVKRPTKYLYWHWMITLDKGPKLLACWSVQVASHNLRKLNIFSQTAFFYWNTKPTILLNSYESNLTFHTKYVWQIPRILEYISKNISCILALLFFHVIEFRKNIIISELSTLCNYSGHLESLFKNNLKIKIFFLKDTIYLFVCNTRLFSLSMKF